MVDGVNNLLAGAGEQMKSVSLQALAVSEDWTTRSTCGIDGDGKKSRSQINTSVETRTAE